MRKDVQLQKS